MNVLNVDTSGFQECRSLKSVRPALSVCTRKLNMKYETHARYKLTCPHCSELFVFKSPILDIGNKCEQWLLEVAKHRKYCSIRRSVSEGLNEAGKHFLRIAACLLILCGSAYASEIPVPVKTIIGECANCSDDGMIAVANVIRNRAKARNQSFEAVCLAPWQFSAWNDKTWLEAHLKRNKGVLQRAYSAWQASATEDLTNGADHYFANYIPKPSWAKSMEHVATHGVHEFYRSR